MKTKSYWPVPKRPVGDDSKPGEGSSTVMDALFPVYGYRIGIVFADDVRRTVSYYFTNFDWKVEDGIAFHLPFKHESRAMIFLPFDADPNTIAHECYHGVRRLLQHLGVGLYEDAGVEQIDNECVAYHLGYLVGLVHKYQKSANKSKREWHAKHKNQLRQSKRKNAR